MYNYACVVGDVMWCGISFVPSRNGIDCAIRVGGPLRSVSDNFVKMASGRKRPREDTAESRTGRIVVEVGGERFVTTVDTLSMNSEYFRSKFEHWDHNIEEQPELFLDRDPDTFRILLTCMRQRKPLLPEHDKGLFKRTICDAEYLGLNWLVDAVKAEVVDHSTEENREAMLRNYNSSRLQEDDAPDTPKPDLLHGYSNEVKARMFDQTFQSFDFAFEHGFLPAQFFASVKKTVKVKQLIPAPDRATAVFYKDGQAEQARPVVCLALVESWRGDTHIEPIVRGRGLKLPTGARSFLTTEDDEQLIPASSFYPKDADRDWAYAYADEAAIQFGLHKENMMR